MIKVGSQSRKDAIRTWIVVEHHIFGSYTHTTNLVHGYSSSAQLLPTDAFQRSTSMNGERATAQAKTRIINSSKHAYKLYGRQRTIDSQIIPNLSQLLHVIQKPVRSQRPTPAPQIIFFKSTAFKSFLLLPSFLISLFSLFCFVY